MRKKLRTELYTAKELADAQSAANIRAAGNDNYRPCVFARHAFGPCSRFQFRLMGCITGEVVAFVSDAETWDAECDLPAIIWQGRPEDARIFIDQLNQRADVVAMWDQIGSLTA